MKELTIEQKAQRYDEIIAMAKGANLPYYKDDIMAKVKEFVDYLLPELKEKENEDERMIKFITNELACLRATDEKGTVRYNELTEAITWLEKQGKQKPAWSEEDERMISAFNALIEDVQKEHGRDCVYYDDQEVFHKDMQVWLKSLRPQSAWKPSEEQLGALANALGLANNCGEESAFDLRTLHKQLKKLKE